MANNYVVPQTLVHQDYGVNASTGDTVLKAGIFGGHAQLVRYGVATEKSMGLLGAYDPAVDTCFAIPNRDAGGLLDSSYVKLYVDGALLKYYEDVIGSGGTVFMNASYRNRVRASAVNFKTNGAFARDAALLRDVRIGDIVKLRGVVATVSYPLTTYVKDILPDAVAAVVAAPVADVDNETAQAASDSDSKTDGALNLMEILTDASAYDGLPSGFITETYTIRVTASSVGGDLTTATLRVLSASGTDDVLSVTPAANTVLFNVGTRGLQVSFDDNGVGPTDVGVSASDLVAGQEWQVVVNQLFVVPVAASTGSTFDGTSATTYLVEVTRGGDGAAVLDADKPQISVTTTNSYDFSGPTLVTSTLSGGPTDAIAIGTHGAVILWSASALLRKGDRYTVVVTAGTTGAMKTLVLGHSLPSAIGSGDDLDLELFIKKDGLLISRNRIGSAPIVNYTVSETELCTTSAMEAYDSTWASGGSAVALPVVEGTLYMEYRAWKSNLASEIGGISDISGLNDAISGSLHPDNPLKWGVAKALATSAGVEVRYGAVANPNSVDSWSLLVDRLVGETETYGIVPLTKNQTVLDLLAGHCTTMSSPTYNAWRVLWVNGASQAVVRVVPNDILGTFTDDPATSGTQYTLLTIPAANADFITAGVRAGDVVRTSYTSDGFDGVAYASYVVDSVLSQDSIRLVAGPSVAINTAQRVEVWRNSTALEEATAIAAEASSYATDKVRYVWPDRISSGGLEMEGYYACAALAGMRSALQPHKGMTRSALTGFDDASRSAKKFNRDQLDLMAGNGVWILTQNAGSGVVFTRHGVTTGPYADIAQREESVKSNVDELSFSLFSALDPYIGTSNVTDTLLDVLRNVVGTWLSQKSGNATSNEVGSQMLAGSEITQLRQHLTLKDRIYVGISAVLPSPSNNIEAHLGVSVGLDTTTA